MKVLGPTDFRLQPWADGRGQTVELWRQDRDGVLLARLSVATVAEDGRFSLFPGIVRNLTVIEGPGFRLAGEGIALDCAPLVPVAFPGDVAVRTSGTAAGPSHDFNVMTASTWSRPEVRAVTGAELPASGLPALYALGRGWKSPAAGAFAAGADRHRGLGHGAGGAFARAARLTRLRSAGKAAARAGSGC